jgi:hypothetical protein
MPEPNEVTPPAKITFSSEQQVKVDSLLREAMGRAGNEARATAARLEAEMITLRNELAAAKDAAKAEAEGRVGLETSLTVREKEAKAARAETIAVKKQNAIQAAATEHNFFNPQVVSKLTEDKIKWDSEKSKFVVLGDDGSERLGADGNSLTVSAYLKEFGQQNNYLVRGDVKAGIGSMEAQQPPHRTLGQKERLMQYFGKGSSAQKANALGVESPQLYRQYKREAQSLGIIP